MERVPEVLARDPAAIDRRFVEVVGAPPGTAWWASRAEMTPLDVARSMKLEEMVKVLLASRSG